MAPSSHPSLPAPDMVRSAVGPGSAREPARRGGAGRLSILLLLPDQAIEACYEIVPAVHRLWRPIRGEYDDYIFNPKASGYQSLHSAVMGAQA